MNFPLLWEKKTQLNLGKYQSSLVLLFMLSFRWTYKSGGSQKYTWSWYWKEFAEIPSGDSQKHKSKSNYYVCKKTNWCLHPLHKATNYYHSQIGSAPHALNLILNIKWSFYTNFYSNLSILFRSLHDLWDFNTLKTEVSHGFIC